MLGVVHLRTLFEAVQRDPSTLVRSVMREPLIIAEFMTVPKLWSTLRASGERSAIVINEYGTVAGLVTLEDALEEIFGELQDEFDEEEELVITRDDGLSVRGDLSLSALADRYDVELPDDRADTIGGLVWHLLGRLPQKGDEIAVPAAPYSLRVEAMERHAVRRVLVIPDAATTPELQT